MCSRCSLGVGSYSWHSSDLAHEPHGLSLVHALVRHPSADPRAVVTRPALVVIAAAVGTVAATAGGGIGLGNGAARAKLFDLRELGVEPDSVTAAGGLTFPDGPQYTVPQPQRHPPGKLRATEQLTPALSVREEHGRRGERPQRQHHLADMLA